jgi:tetratricopeptide (TPR) repeat protein
MRRLFTSIAALGVLVLSGAPVLAQSSGALPEAPPARTPVTPYAPHDDAGMLLDRLFAQLHKAESVSDAKPVERAIWGLWSRSESPTATALIQQAAKAMTAQNYRVAVKLLDTAIEVKPDFAEAWNKRATVLYLQGEFERSLADIERVLELEPRHFGALAGRGMILREQGDEAGALKAYRRALAIHPHLPGATRAVKQLESEFEQRI